MLEGRGEVLSSMYTSASPYHSDEIEPLAYDPDQAKQMLEDAGFDFNQTLKFGVPTGNAVREQNGNLIQQALTDIGVKVDQQNYDFPTWLQTAQDLDYDIGLMGYGHTVDPNVSTYIQTGATSNNSAIADPVIDDLLAKGNEGTVLMKDSQSMKKTSTIHAETRLSSFHCIQILNSQFKWIT